MTPARKGPPHTKNVKKETNEKGYSKTSPIHLQT